MGEEVVLGTGTESSLVTEIAFWVIAVSTIVAAVAVVQARDIFRAALFLAVAFLGVAGIFILLRAEFLAVVQIIIYVGAITVLLVFAILMTRDVQQGNPTNRIGIPAAGLAALFFGVAAFAVLNTEWNLLASVLPLEGVAPDKALAAETVAKINEVYSNTIPQIAGLLLRDYVLAFEVASVLLLAALIGALVLVRER